MQIVVEVALNEIDWPRAVAQLRYLETLLPSLVQASRQQRLGDTTLPSRRMPRRRAGETQQLSVTTQITR